MYKLFPQDDSINVDPATAIANEKRPPRANRPWVYTNMIASVDGGTAVDGLSGGLGGPADKSMFAALRSVADIILAGSTTVRDEEYKSPQGTEDIRSARVARGQAARPRLAIVTSSLHLDRDLPLFNDPDNRPIILTSKSAPPDRRRELAAVSDVIEAGDEQVDLPLALRSLGATGARRVLSEGGPSLNGQLIADDLVDEWNLSISPHLLGANSRRAAVGPVPSGPPHGMHLARVWSDDNFLFCRWVRS